jgi:hypothetical protein
MLYTRHMAPASVVSPPFQLNLLELMPPRSQPFLWDNAAMIAVKSAPFLPPLLCSRPCLCHCPCRACRYKPPPIATPQLQFSLDPQVACGECHSVALTSDGRVWTWGGAGFGQLGRGKGGKGGVAAVKFDADDCFCFRIAAGAHHTLAAMQGGDNHTRTQCH